MQGTREACRDVPVERLEHIGRAVERLEHIGRAVERLEHIGRAVEHLEHIGRAVEHLEHIGRAVERLEHIGRGGFSHIGVKLETIIVKPAPTHVLRLDQIRDRV